MGCFILATPISSFSNPSKYHLKHYFHETSRSPLERMPFPSELTRNFHSILSCIHGTVFESQALKQDKPIFRTYFQMNKQILEYLCPSLLCTWGKISLGILSNSAALTVCDDQRWTIGLGCFVLVRFMWVNQQLRLKTKSGDIIQ